MFPAREIILRSFVFVTKSLCRCGIVIYFLHYDAPNHKLHIFLQYRFSIFHISSLTCNYIIFLTFKFVWKFRSFQTCNKNFGHVCFTLEYNMFYSYYLLKNLFCSIELYLIWNITWWLQHHLFEIINCW